MVSLLPHVSDPLHAFAAHGFTLCEAGARIFLFGFYEILDLFSAVFQHHMAHMLKGNMLVGIRKPIFLQTLADPFAALRRRPDRIDLR